MRTSRDSFFLIDFDRCLNDVDACFDLFQDVVCRLRIVERSMLDEARHKTETSGGSFSVIEFLEKNHISFDLSEVEKLYIDRAKKVKGLLLAPGAVELIDYLRTNEIDFSIMTFGELRWQKLKIDACGLNNVMFALVKDRRKSIYINEWYDENGQQFQIPSSYFIDNTSRLKTEVVLIDDKPIAFEGLCENARGYLVGRHRSSGVAKNIQVVSSLFEITSTESNILSTSVK